MGVVIINVVLNVYKTERLRELTLMERYERVEGTKDLSELALCHDVQLQHGLIIHLVAQVKRTCRASVEA